MKNLIYERSYLVYRLIISIIICALYFYMQIIVKILGIVWNLQTLHEKNITRSNF